MEEKISEPAKSSIVVNGSSQATATVRIINGAGQPVGGAKVSVLWSGAYTHTASANTNGSGTATFNSSKLHTTLPYTLTTTKVSGNGLTWDGLNKSGSGTLIRAR